MADEYNTSERSVEETEELRHQAEAVTGDRMNEPVEVAPTGYTTHGADGGKYNIGLTDNLPASQRLNLSAKDVLDKGETSYVYTDPVLSDNQMTVDPSKDFISPTTLAPSSGDFDSTPISVNEKAETLHIYKDPVLSDNQRVVAPSKDFISPTTLAPSSSDFDSTPTNVKEKVALMSKILKKDQEQKHKPVDKLTEIDIALDDLPF